MDESRAYTPVSHRKGKNGPLVLLTLLFVAACAVAFYFYQQNQNAKKMLNTSTSAGKEIAQQVIEKVGKIMDLPTDEAPTIANVVDKQKLKGQQFFARAEKGDVVLIYVKAKKAIIYRPSTNKIIEVGSINVDPQKQSAPSASPTSATPSASPTTAE